MKQNSIFILALTVGLFHLCGPAFSAGCVLNGKTLNYVFLRCRDRVCDRMHERMSIVGNKILVFDAEATNSSGQLYYIGEKRDITDDPNQLSDELASSDTRLVARTFASAVISDGVIRTMWERFSALHQGDPIRLRVLDLRTIRVSGDCAECIVVEHDLIAGGVGTFGKQSLTRMESCSISDG